MSEIGGEHHRQPETLEEALEEIALLRAAIIRVRGEEEPPADWPQTLPSALSAIDGLTGVIERNRRDDLLPSMLKRSEIIRDIEERINIGTRFGLIVIDLDNFKQVNDTFKHAMGNSVLIELANLLKTQFRRADESKLDLLDRNESEAGRLGGDEAVISFDLFEVEAGLREGQQRMLSPEVQIKMAEDKIRAIGEELVAKFPDLREVGFGISLGGIAFNPKLPVDAEALLDRADELALDDKLQREYSWFCQLPPDEQDEVREARVVLRRSILSDRRAAKTFAALDKYEPLPE